MICPKFKYHDYTKVFSMRIPSTDEEFYEFRTSLNNFIENSYIEITVRPVIEFNIDENRGFSDNKEDLTTVESFFNTDNIISNANISVLTNINGSSSEGYWFKFVFLNSVMFSNAIEKELTIIFSNLETKYDINFSKFYKIHVAKLFAKTLAIIYESIVTKEGKETADV